MSYRFSAPRSLLVSVAGLAGIALLTATLSACGGGSDKGATPTRTPGASTSAPGDQQHPCTVSLATSGAATVTWYKEPGQVTLDTLKASGPTPAATYSAVKGSTTLSVYSAGSDGWKPSVTIAIGKTVYATQPDSSGTVSGLSAAEDGSKAKLSVDVASATGKSAHVQAAISCSDKAMSGSPTKQGKSTSTPSSKGKSSSKGRGAKG